MKARIVVIICLFSLFSILTGCISTMGYMDRVVALGALGVGYGAVQSQREGPEGEITVIPGPSPTPTPVSGLPWKFPAGAENPTFVISQFTGPWIIHEDYTTTVQKDYNAFYGVTTFDSSSDEDATRGVLYTIAYYDNERKFLFRDNYIYPVGIRDGDTVPIVTLFEPVDYRIAGATIENMTYLIDPEEEDNKWWGNFIFSNVAVSPQGISGKLVQLASLHEDGDEDKEREEMVVTAAFYNSKGQIIDVIIDDGGPNHEWEWGLYSVPGTNDTFYQAEFDIAARKSFATYTLHYQFFWEDD